MAFCRNCGAQIHDEAVVCVNCGTTVLKSANMTNPADKKSGGFATLCFFIPVLGLILYLVWNKEYPLKAKSCAKGGIIGFVLSNVLSIIFVIIYFVFIAAMVEDPSIMEAYGEEYYNYLMLLM